MNNNPDSGIVLDVDTVVDCRQKLIVYCAGVQSLINKKDMVPMNSRRPINSIADYRKHPGKRGYLITREQTADFRCFREEGECSNRTDLHEMIIIIKTEE